VLSSPGTAVFQIVNFDRILSLGDTELPLIERENLRFTRIYRPRSEERLVFDSALEVTRDDGRRERFENSIELRPIRKADLEQWLFGAGFTSVRTYGDFRKGEYSLSSQATVMVARC